MTKATGSRLDHNEIEADCDEIPSVLDTSRIPSRHSSVDAEQAQRTARDLSVDLVNRPFRISASLSDGSCAEHERLRRRSSSVRARRKGVLFFDDVLVFGALKSRNKRPVLRPVLMVVA